MTSVWALELKTLSLNRTGQLAFVEFSAGSAAPVLFTLIAFNLI
jgi:hypothetical protein